MLIKLGQFLVVFSAMVGVSIIVAILGVLFGGFNATFSLPTWKFPLLWQGLIPLSQSLAWRLLSKQTPSLFSFRGFLKWLKFLLN